MGRTTLDELLHGFVEAMERGDFDCEAYKRARANVDKEGDLRAVPKLRVIYGSGDARENSTGRDVSRTAQHLRLVWDRGDKA